MRIHFIAIGGAAMHNLAIALKRKGHTVTGSDDQIFDPSRGRLEKEGLLPAEMGWFPDSINQDLDAIILGMHARKNNPELMRALDLDLNVYSYPEFLFQETKNKKRVVIGGSHGKTTITAMILHVLKKAQVHCDFMVGAQLEGFDCMVKLSDAPIVILEGDEYLSSPIDLKPKFHWYKPQLALLTGIAWDHINVFPTFENYLEQFKIFINSMAENSTLIYFNGDENLEGLIKATDRKNIRFIPYNTPKYRVDKNISILNYKNQESPLRVFGKHNMQNLLGAQHICENLGIDGTLFIKHIASFSGAARRLELVISNDQTSIYKDFAHAPSKLKATTEALKEQFPNRELVACMELHTFSSLNAKFLNEYQGTMDHADQALIYYNPDVIKHKKLEPLSPEKVKKAFANQSALIYTDSTQLREDLLHMNWNQKNLLWMTSGNFNGINLEELADEIII